MSGNSSSPMSFPSIILRSQNAALADIQPLLILGVPLPLDSPLLSSASDARRTMSLGLGDFRGSDVEDGDDEEDF